MELTIRTTHGAADVAIGLHDAAVTLRDVIAVTTGQAVPSAALVDGQLVDTGLALSSVALRSGSIIETDLAAHLVPSSVIDLLQTTGPGAGTTRPLPPGRYRVGPSIRLSTAELDFDAVENTAFEIDVHASGARLSPGGSPSAVMLDGSPLTETRSWIGGQLVVEGRSFLVEPSRPQTRPAPPGTSNGSLVHNRPPGSPPATRRYLVDALLDAAERRHGLWHHRANAATMPIDAGVIDDAADATGAVIDLAQDGVIAIAGTSDDGEAVLRSLLIEATTRFGPADLAVTVATSRDRLHAWDWAKWLPHARSNDAPDLLANDLEIASWAANARSDEQRRALLVVTDVELWNHAGAPLRQLINDRPDRVTVFALCSDRSAAPTTTSTLIELDHAMPGRARLVRIARDASIELRVGLVDVDTATDVARHLAPLVDPDLALSASIAPESARPSLAEIVAAADATTRWNTQLGAPGNEFELGVGVLAGRVVGIDLGIDRGVMISGSSVDEADAIAQVIALSMGSAWSPDELSIVEIDHRNASSYDAARHLPHFTGTFDDRGPDAATRFAERLHRAVTDDELAGKRLAIFVRGLAETELATPDLVATLAALASDTLGVHLVVTTASPLTAIDESIRQACPVEIAVERYGGTRRATAHDRDQQLRTSFAPYDAPAQIDEAVTVEPFLFGRSPTPLERRLDRASGGSAPPPDRLVLRLVDDLCALANDRNMVHPAALVPAPLPRVLDADDFLARHRGDGVPIGLTETPDSTTPAPHWWQPGPGGSILAIGAPRAGMRRLLDVLACGIVDRFGTDDLTISAIEHQVGRRAALATVPHVIGIASPEQPNEVRQLIENALAELRLRRDDTTFRIADVPAHLVLVRDLERLHSDVHRLLAELAELGPAVGLNVVATAARPADAGPLLEACSSVLVGSLSEPSDYSLVGVERAERFDSIPGRCAASFDGGQAMLQLAGLETSLDEALAARSAR